MSQSHIVIPARYASTRLPGKPLALIGGKPMIQHVVARAEESGVGEVIVATDDERIRDAVEGFGGKVFLTSVDHATGTDRINEVAEAHGWGDDDPVINVQGDEPFISPRVISQVAENLLSHGDAGIATVCAPFDDLDEVDDVNAVKVVRDFAGYALYFSRSVIPGQRPDTVRDLAIYRRHIGIYAYRVHALRVMATTPKHPLEMTESLEQLRYMAQGGRIHCDDACEAMLGGVDTPQDLEKANSLLAE